MLLARLAKRAPDGLAQRRRVAHAIVLQLLARARVRRQDGVAAHDRRRLASDALKPAVVDAVHRHRVALLVGKHRRHALHAVDAERRHLQLGKRPAHQITVDHGNVPRRAQDERDRRVHAAGLHRVDGVGLLPQLAHQFVVGCHGLLPAADLLHHDRRGAHHLRHHDKRIVGNLIGADQLHVSVSPDGLDRHQLSHIGVSSAPRAENRRAERHVLDLFNSYASSHECRPSPKESRVLHTCAHLGHSGA